MKNFIIAACLVMAVFVFAGFNANNSGNRISNYVVIESGNYGNFESNVETRLEAGWKLSGGVTYGNGRYMQAMYK